ncbi:hypothetical protein [Spirosoma flavum]|uniref:Uncharacterized protein n=1 Tax=Spirosoma flavum TaxID=2048557 RepID=A0ABW6AIM2_9BACT
MLVIFDHPTKEPGGRSHWSRQCSAQRPSAWRRAQNHALIQDGMLSQSRYSTGLIQPRKHHCSRTADAAWSPKTFSSRSPTRHKMPTTNGTARVPSARLAASTSATHNRPCVSTTKVRLRPHGRPRIDEFVSIVAPKLADHRS